MKTIYFVHDQEDNHASREHFLEVAGFTVKSMTSGRELFVALKEAEPALVLMDILLEGRNGFEVCRDLDSRYLRRSFPILLCTRIYNTHVFQEEAFNSGAQDYLMLPMEHDELIKRIHDALEAWNGRAQAPGTAA